MKTDIDAVRNVAIAFLHEEPVEIEGMPFVTHPFFETNPAPYMKDGELKAFDLFDEEEFDAICGEYEKQFMRIKKPQEYLMILRTPYLLAFVKYAEPFLSEKDFAEMLSWAWTNAENPNDDVNVSVEEAIDMFRRADKKYLMDEEEYELYRNLPDEMTAYRGIANGHNPKGLSYTLDKDVAQWFADRFRGHGYILEATVKKEDVLAYFASRNEEEVVVDSTRVKPFVCKED